MMCPKDIYQAHLDKAGQAILDYDFSTVLDMVHYPSFIETDDVTLRIPDRESYLPSIKSLRDNFAKRGVTAYYRICREAVFAHDDPNRIEGIHEVYALSGATPVLDPYLTQMSLILRDGKWLGAGLRSATSNKHWQLVKHPEPIKASPVPETALKETQI